MRLIDYDFPFMSVRELPTAVDREELVAWLRRNEQRARQLYDLLSPDAYTLRPIALRNPIVFYEGHLAAFAINTLIKRSLGEEGIDEHYETLFARGIDPEDEAAAGAASGKSIWPPRAEVRSYVERVSARITDALRHGAIEVEGDPLRERAIGAMTILEHDPMHHETLLYMWHQLAYDLKRKPAGASADLGSAPPPSRQARIPAGRATLGNDPDKWRFGWDNEFRMHTVDVPAFDIDVYSVTNRGYLEFMADGGYRREELWAPEMWKWREKHDVRNPNFWRLLGTEWRWQGMFEEFALPPAWPVYVSQAEAAAYAQWRGRRLPTEAEYHRAAFGTPGGVERSFPWGEDLPSMVHGNFDFRSWDPVPVGGFPAGTSAWGIHDLVGNGWEWTRTIFAPFEGFVPLPTYPNYSADFFDGEHYVLKGASPATASELIRRSFRNWFRPNYPYIYAKFRTVG